MSDVAILAHLSRSGSTLLCSLLDELEDVAVSIEGDIPDGLTVPWVPIRDEATLDRALDALFAGRKFRLWPTDRETLRRRLAAKGYPIAFPDWLTAILDEALGGAGARVHLYKRGPYAGCLRALHQSLPDARVIAVVRDPRAIFHSQHRQGMARRAVPFAMGYNSYVRALRRFSGEPWLCIVPYEALVEQPDAERRRIATFLGVDPGRLTGSDYAARIPASQAPRHVRLSEGVRSDIATEWRDGLDVRARRSIEMLCAGSMVAMGYPREKAAGGGLEAWRAVAGDFVGWTGDRLARLFGRPAP